MIVRQHLLVELDVRRAEVVLILCFFVSGLVDSVSTSLFGCFVMMQTGNTIYLALGVTNHPRYSPSFAWIKALSAIGCFWLGSLFFSTFHRALGPLKRYVVMGSFAIQSILIVAAAVLINAKVASHSKQTSRLAKEHSQTSIGPHAEVLFPWLDLLPIAFLSFQSAGQVYASRVLKQTLLPTVVLTAIYCDIISSINKWRKEGIFGDVQRNARIAGAMSLFIGAMVGGLMGTSYHGGYAGALWLAAGLKSAMVGAWFLWKPMKLQEAESLV